jgi:hypothetical protein
MLTDNNNDQKNSKFFIFLAGLTFIIPLLLFYYYNSTKETLSIGGVELKKIDQQEQFPSEEIEPILSAATIINTKTDSTQKDQPLKISKLINLEVKQKVVENAKRTITDTIIKLIEPENSVTKSTEISTNISTNILDSTKQRILLMGDSECGGLCYQLNDYCIQNGHKLVASIVWNSASIFNFAYSDTVTKIIQKYKPTYIMIVVGLNELYARDIPKRKKAAQILAKKIEGIPYTWVGPANFTEDRGINKAFYESAQSGTFYLSKKLIIPKGGDKRHPSIKGYRIWMDSLAVWMQNDAKYKITLTAPVKRNKAYKSKLIILNAAKYRGY